MFVEGNLDYALARVHTHHAERFDERAWRALEASRDAGQYLESMRATPLRNWTAALDGSSDPHAIDRALRTGWRHYVEQASRWHPREWQEWLTWCAWLPALPLLARLSLPAPPPHWMLADPVCGTIAPGTLAERAAALRTTELAPLEPALLGQVQIATTWRKQWQLLLPPCDEDTKALLTRLLQAIDAHANSVLANTAPATVLREHLSERLARLFRLASGTVIATVCHLGMVALDLQRLRGGLVSRVIFSAYTGKAA